MDIFDKGHIVYFTDVTQGNLDETLKFEPFAQTFSEEYDLERVGVDDKFLYLHWSWGTTDIIPLQHLIRLSTDKENK